MTRRATSSSSRETPVASEHLTVRDPRTGEVFQVKGAGALAGRVLKLKPGVDLTKPIFEQVSRSR